MKRTPSYIVGIIGLVIGLIAPTASTQAATAVGPYYATPSWDQQLPASTRFIVLSNWIDADFPLGGAAVLDRETGAVWERSPSVTPEIHFLASFSCNTRNTGGRGSWRLPSFQELASLFQYTGQSGALPPGHPFQNLQASFYWTYNTAGAGSAWLLDLRNGINARFPVGETANFWCVRSPAPGPLNQPG